MVDVSNYSFKYITDKTVKPEESFVNSYVEECLESESAINSTCRMCRMLDANYKKADLNKVMTEQCQHLTATESIILLHVLKKFKDLFDGALGTWKTTPLYLELKDKEKSVLSRPYPVQKLHEVVFRKEIKRLVSLGVL